MYRSTLLPAVITTVISAPFVFFINPSQPAARTATMLGIVLLASFASALMALRSRQQPQRRPTKSGTNRPSITPPIAEGPRESGKVKWFNASKGFGFITRDSGDDVFVHFRSIRGEGHRILRDGQRVEFSISQGDKGLQADDVVGLSG